MQRCTSNPACDLWDETMLLDIREREREAQINRLGRAAARPAPVVRNDPPQNPVFGAFGRAFGMFRNVPDPLPPQPPRPEPPRVAARGLGHGDVTDFEWIDNPRTCARYAAESTVLIILQPGITVLTHPFTRQMITTLTCGYCNSQLNSINDLRYHLTNVRYHSVFSCCGRFFKREVDFDRHKQAKPFHDNQVATYH